MKIHRKELENIKKQIVLKFQMTEIEQERVREIANSYEQKHGELKSQTQKSKEENNEKMERQDIRKNNIHNQFKFKNGLEMLKINEENYIVSQKFQDLNSTSTHEDGLRNTSFKAWRNE